MIGRFALARAVTGYGTATSEMSFAWLLAWSDGLLENLNWELSGFEAGDIGISECAYWLSSTYNV